MVELAVGLSVEEYLRIARTVEASLKRNVKVFSGLYTRVAGIRWDGPFVNERGEIWLPSPQDALDVARLSGYPVSTVVDGWLRHENAHVVSYPFVAYITPFLAVFHGMAKEFGLPVNGALLSTVNNIVSDVLVDVGLARLSIAGALPVTNRSVVLRSWKGLLRMLRHRRHVLEANPAGAVFALYLDLYARGAIRNGVRVDELKFEPPSYPSEVVFNRLLWIVEAASIEKLYTVVASARLAPLLGEIIRGGMYERAVQVGLALRDAVAQAGESALAGLERSLQPVAEGEKGAIELYFRIVLGLYHYYVNTRTITVACRSGKSASVAPLPSLMETGYTGDARVERVSVEEDRELLEALYQELKEIGGGVGGSGRARVRLVSGRLLRAIALKIVRTGLMVAGGTSPFARAERRITRVPWYRRPSGRLVPSTMARSRSPLDWAVRVRGRGLPSGETGVGRAPENITLIIDESGSVLHETGILRPYTGFDVTVYDVERTVALGVLLRTLELGNPPTALYRFSDSYKREEYDAAGAARRLETIREGEVLARGTNLSEPLADAVKRHKDGPLNYLVIVTDMELSAEDAEAVGRLLSGIRKSPTLIAVAGKKLPDELAELGEKANIAVALLEEESGLDSIVTALAKLFSYTREVMSDEW